MIFNTLPVFLGKAAESYALDDSEAGWLGTIYLAGFGLSSVSASFWLQRVDRRGLAFAIYAAAGLLLVLGTTLDSYSLFAALLFAVGYALGALYTLSFVLAGEFQDATRAVGVKLGGEVALGALLLFLLPVFVYPAFGFGGMLVALALVLLILSPCALFASPAGGAAQPVSMVEGRGGNRGGVPVSALAALGALLVFTVGQSAVWSFVERVGVRANYGAAGIGAALSIAVLMGGLASFLAAIISERFGRMKPMVFSAAAYILAMLMFALGEGFLFYAAAINLFFFVWLFALPYLVSAVTAADGSGRGASLVTACFAFGSMLGPATAGQLVQGADFDLLYLAGAILTLIAYATMGRLALRRCAPAAAGGFGAGLGGKARRRDGDIDGRKDKGLAG